MGGFYNYHRPHGGLGASAELLSSQAQKLSLDPTELFPIIRPCRLNTRKTMKLLNILALFALAALLAGCATGSKLSSVKSTLPTLEAGKGRVYFYRTSIVGGGYQPNILLNEQVTGRATPWGVYFKDVPPGEYTVTTTMTSTKVSFSLAEGQKKYVRLSYRFGFNIYPELIDGSVGDAEIQGLSYTGTK